MSGKSTYLRAVALAVVMAQAGCFVPAAFASLPPVDALLCRLGAADDLESGASSFMVEAREAAALLRAATPRSLALVDELGRATGTADGIAISWAVAEALAASGARALFATHFGQLAELAAALPNARCWHFSMREAGGRLEFPWALAPGGDGGAGRYGLALARAVGFPAEVLDRADAIVEALEAKEAARRVAYAAPAAAGEAAGGDAAETAAVWRLAGQLACVAQAFAGGGDDVALTLQLRALQREAAEALAGGGAASGGGGAVSG
jgi:DNA mismatch repair ATPase MutS